MVERLNTWLNLVFNIGVMALALITPFIFWDFTSEFYETPKFFFLVFVIGILLILWAIKTVVTGKLSFTKTALDIPFFMLLAVLVISTFFSSTKSVAIFGSLPRIHGGLASFASYIILYFVLVSNLKQVNQIKQIIYLLLVAGVGLSLLALASYAGLNLFSLPWTAGLNFTPTGSSFSTAAILALLLPFPMMIILQDAEREVLGGLGNDLRKATGLREVFSVQTLNKVLLTLVMVLFAGTLALIGSLPTYIAAIAAVTLAVFTTSPVSIKKNLPFVALPIITALVLLFVSFVPLGGSSNFFYSQAQKLPREVQLPFQISWKVSVSTFRDNPFWGTGPSTFLSDFTFYKPVEFNATKVWNTRFDQAFNEYLQVLATLGILGLISLLLLTAIFISKASQSISRPQGSIDLSLAISGIIFFILLALHTSTLPLMVAGVIILASFMANHSRSNNDIKLGLGIGTNSNEPRIDLFPFVLLALIAVLVGYSYIMIGRFAIADYHHRQAIVAVSQGKGLDAYNELVAAEKFNPEVDLYRSDLAQTNFALANAIAAAKGPTEASPTGSLTDEDKQNIQTLLSQAITEGRVATSLNPNNPLNWEILGSIYRQISGVAQNALAFSLDSYGHAIQRDPLNPVLRLTVGGIYYSVKNYDMAIRFFTDAVNLKPDYANAYFNLAVTLRDKGDLVGAATAAERTVSLLDPNSPDYQTASQLLSGLKDQVASLAAQQQAQQQVQQQKIQAPAAKNKSALEGKNLPQVLDLPKPEKVATPPAVKKPTEEQ